MGYDYSQRVQLLNPDGSFVLKFGSFGSNPGQFHNLVDATTDSSGNIYVLDDANITCYTAAGVYSHRWSVNGGRSIAQKNDIIYVLSYTHLYKYNLGGSPVGSYLNIAQPVGHSGTFWMLRNVLGNNNYLYLLAINIPAEWGLYGEHSYITFRRIDILSGSKTDTIYTDYTTDNGRNTTGIILGMVPLYTTGYPIAYISDGWYNYAVTIGSYPVLQYNPVTFGDGLAYGNGYYYFGRHGSFYAPAGNLIVKTADIRVRVPGIAATFAPKGYADGEFAYNVTPPPTNEQKTICRPCCMSNGRLVVLDGTYLPKAAELSSDIDRLFGFHHAVHTDSAGNGLAHQVAPINAAFEAPAVAITAAGTGPGVKVLPDGRLRAVYADGAGVTQTKYSRDLGHTWGVS